MPPRWTRWGRFVVLALACAGVAAAVEIGSRVPLEGLERLQGGSAALPRGQVVVLNLFATWCPPCIRELPHLDRLDQLGRANGKWRVIGICGDLRERAALRRFAAEQGIGFELWYAPEDGVEERFGLLGYPTTLILDRRGRVVRRVVGPEAWDSPEWRAELEAIYAAGATAAARP